MFRVLRCTVWDLDGLRGLHLGLRALDLKFSVLRGLGVPIMDLYGFGCKVLRVERSRSS